MANLQQYKVITATHRKVQLKDLGCFAIEGEKEVVNLQLAKIKGLYAFDEIMYLQTCNRILFLIVTNTVLDKTVLRNVFQDLNPTFEPEYVDQLEVFEGEAAVKHVFSLGASVDSMVVGEREILRQLRASYASSQEAGLTGDSIRVLMRYVVESSKAVYSRTRIGEKPVSVVSLAIRKLMKLNPAENSRILLIGAGQTNALVSKFLFKYGFRDVSIFNRSLDKAEILGKPFSGHCGTLEDLESYAKGFDIIIACTGSQKAILTDALYTQLLQNETDQKIVVDLAVPANVETGLQERFDMELIEIEGLKALAKENLKAREKEVDKVMALLEIQIQEFKGHFNARQVEIAMRELPTEIKAIRERAMTKVFNKEIAELDDSAQELVTRMMSYMEKKCVGVPMSLAKKAVLEGE